MIEEFAALIPQDVMNESGSVFYSGRSAFSAPSPLYILGGNPGGSPQEIQQTVKWQTEMVLKGPDDWSAYKDDQWRKKPGKSGMQPRVLHLFSRLKLDPQRTPASNVVFVRSAREKDIKARFKQYATLCWPFHEAVIERLAVRVVLCFGRSAGDWVCKQLNAETLVSKFVEKNNRRWPSRCYRNSNGMVVVVVTHPSIADWTTPEADPSELVQTTLEQAVMPLSCG